MSLLLSPIDAGEGGGRAGGAVIPTPVIFLKKINTREVITSPSYLPAIGRNRVAMAGKITRICMGSDEMISNVVANMYYVIFWFYQI